jgi:hypothetical protein
MRYKLEDILTFLTVIEAGLPIGIKYFGVDVTLTESGSSWCRNQQM